jgi:hypothetical protein
MFCGEEFVRSLGTVAHELGHTFGLRHSYDPTDLMASYYHSWRETTPPRRERLEMALLLERRPGSVWPDDDRTAKFAARRSEIVE